MNGGNLPYGADPFPKAMPSDHPHAAAAKNKAESNEEYRRNLERNYESQVFKVVFRGVQVCTMLST